MSATPEAPTDDETPSNVLLLAPPFGAPEDRLCGELLHPRSERRPHVVFCCLRSPAPHLDGLGEHAGIEPASTTVVDVDASARSAAATPDGSRDVTVDRVSDPSDLLTVGKTLTGHLDRAGETILCVDSLTDMLQYTGEREVFRFLDVLTDTVEKSGGLAHYHLDPEAHDQETIRTLEVQFDAVIDPRDAGERANGA